MVEPYKSEILPHWCFRTPDVAEKSARKIYSMFRQYGKLGDFVGMDMARKFLQMGFTRARRYANHPSGRKYRKGSREVLPQAVDWETSPKAESARIFYDYYEKAKRDKRYLALKAIHEGSA